MTWATPAAARAFAVRFHTAECVCKGDLDSCAAYLAAQAKGEAA